MKGYVFLPGFLLLLACVTGMMCLIAGAIVVLARRKWFWTVLGVGAAAAMMLVALAIPVMYFTSRVSHESRHRPAHVDTMPGPAAFPPQQGWRYLDERSPIESAPEAAPQSLPTPDSPETVPSTPREEEPRTESAEIRADSNLGALTTAETPAEDAEPAAESGDSQSTVESPPQETAPAATAQVNRPAWIDTVPREVDGCTATVVSSGPFVTLEECDNDAARQMAAVIRQFARSKHNSSAEVPIRIMVRPRDNQRLSRERYVEDVESSVGPMHSVHYLVVFDSSFRGHAESLIQEALALERSRQVGLAASSVLGALALTYGGLRVVTAKKRRRYALV